MKEVSFWTKIERCALLKDQEKINDTFLLFRNIYDALMKVNMEEFEKENGNLSKVVNLEVKFYLNNRKFSKWAKLRFLCKNSKKDII